MSSILARLSIVAAASIAFGASVPALADVVVVRSSGPSAASYPPGRRLPDLATVNLQASDNLIVLGRGGTRNLRGPGAVAVTGPARTSPLASAISAQSRQRRTRIGAVRGVDAEPGLWDLQVTHSGNFCARTGSRLVLWRTDPAAPAILSIGPRRIDWPIGRPNLGWPDGVPLTHGEQYVLGLSTEAAPNSVRIMTLTNPPTDPVDLAEVLIRHGCQSQLERLLQSVPSA